MSSQASSSRRAKTILRVGDENDPSEWEDESFEQTFDEIIKEESEADPSPSNSVTNERSRRLPSSPGSSRRRRHVVGANTSTDTSRRSRLPKARKDAASHRLPRQQEDEDPPYKDITPEVIRGATKVFLFTFSYLFDILKGILYLAKPLFTLIIAIYILSVLARQLSASIQTVLQPICILPGTSSIPLCAHLALKPRQADFQELVERQTASFEQILDQSVGGSTLALEVKKSELATKDLLILVRASELKSSTSIADSLVRFIKDAKRASDGLQLLSSHIQFTVDSIVSVNDYALVSIQQARDRETSMSALQLLNPFAVSTQDVVVAKFTDAMDHVSERVNHLLLEGETQLQNLEQLEQHLDVLSEIVGREGLSISSERDDVLASLWTHLGANRVKLRRFSSELSLLRAITDYRKRALVHVISAIHTLQEMKSDLEVIRERVSTPGLAGSSIPVEVHLTSIQSGLTRLKQSRLNAQERERKALDTIMNSLP